MRKSSRTRTSLLIAAVVAVVAPLGIIAAHDENATGIYKTRHDAYHKLGDAFKTIRDQVKSGSPDLAAIRSAADVVNETSVNQFNWFPAGSGPAPGVKTRAKAEIWSRPQDFEAAQKLFADQAKKFHTVVAGNDVAAISAQFAELGKSC